MSVGECGYPSCTALVFGDLLSYCSGHSLQKMCAYFQCDQMPRPSSTFCIQHGGRQRCVQPFCCKSADANANKCSIHLGEGDKSPADPPDEDPSVNDSPAETDKAPVCERAGCSAKAKKGGFCWKHAGKGLCVMADCMAEARHEGLCEPHSRKAKRWKKDKAGRHVGAKAEGGSVEGERCRVSGCTSEVYKHRRCRRHARRVSKVCKVDGCARISRKSGLCGLHLDSMDTTPGRASAVKEEPDMETDADQAPTSALQPTGQSEVDWPERQELSAEPLVRRNSGAVKSEFPELEQPKLKKRRSADITTYKVPPGLWPPCQPKCYQCLMQPSRYAVNTEDCGHLNHINK